MNFYLIQHWKKPALLYTENEKASPQDPDSKKGLADRWLAWLTHRNTRVAHFLKNVTIVVRDYYNRLEYKIDPMERVFKRMRYASEIRLHFSSSIAETRAAAMLERLCARQGNKHLFWFGVDLVITLIAIILSPILVPIPGPNFFFYYPGLRTMSHFLAWRGVVHGPRLKFRSYFPQVEIFELEAVLRNNAIPIDKERIKELSQSLSLEQLPHFLDRYI